MQNNHLWGSGSEGKLKAEGVAGGIRTWRKPLITCPHLKHKAKLEEFKAGGPLRVTRATTKCTASSTTVKIFSLSLVFSSLNIMYLGVVFSVVVWLGINWGSSNVYLVFSLGISCDKRDKGVFYSVSEVTFVKPLGNLGMRASCQGNQSHDWRVRIFSIPPPPTTSGKGTMGWKLNQLPMANDLINRAYVPLPM